MYINKLYEYPVLERQTAENGPRFYLDPNTGTPLPSVTTVLDLSADKSFLVEWEKRVGKAKADTIREDAAALGTLLHTHMECYVQGIERPRGNNLIRQMSRDMADVIIREGMPKVNEVWGIEVPLYFPETYAGTSDLVGVHEGVPAIMDYKNTRKMKEKSKIGDYFCQGAAYAMAHNEVYGTKIRKIVIFMADRQLNYKEFVVEGNEFDSFRDQYLRRLNHYLDHGQMGHAEGAVIETEIIV